VSDTGNIHTRYRVLRENDGLSHDEALGEIDAELAEERRAADREETER
jgi:hypothetical protein